MSIAFSNEIPRPLRMQNIKMWHKIIINTSGAL